MWYSSVVRAGPPQAAQAGPPASGGAGAAATGAGGGFGRGLAAASGGRGKACWHFWHLTRRPACSSVYFRRCPQLGQLVRCKPRLRGGRAPVGNRFFAAFQSTPGRRGFFVAPILPAGRPGGQTAGRCIAFL